MRREHSQCELKRNSVTDLSWAESALQYATGDRGVPMNIEDLLDTLERPGDRLSMRNATACWVFGSESRRVSVAAGAPDFDAVLERDR